jgi:sulfite exporter TauE/SafE
MCGGFALLLGMGRPSLARNLLTQLCYTAGRVCTYTALGATAGFIGMRMAQSAQSWGNIPAALCVLAGLFLVVEGLAAAGINLRVRHWSGSSAMGCLVGSPFGSLLRGPGLQNAFAAGLLTGFLPCGLVYAFLSLAAATGDLVSGGVTMAVFGLGTLPLMVTTGAGGMLLSLMSRRRLLRAAAWCVVLTGCVTIARGAGFLPLPGRSSSPACPFCQPTEPGEPAESQP